MLILGVGWVAATCLFGPRGIIGIVILGVGLPAVIVLTAVLAPTMVSWQLNALAIAIAEAIVIAIALLSRVRTPEREFAHV